MYLNLREWRPVAIFFGLAQQYAGLDRSVNRPARLES